MPGTFLVEDRQVQGPATHAIVIGVGHYRHLPGGGERQVASPEGMGQLTSPPISARAIATWLIKTLNYPVKPLATVALLLSERAPKPFRNPNTGADIPVQVATIDNLEEALTEWRQRGDTTPDQRLVLYFCGHGMGKGSDLALLAADYGEKALNALDGAIDFRNFLMGMELSASREQVYFIDACRVHSGSLLRAGRNNGRSIFQGDSAVSPGSTLRAPVFYSTLAGSLAYARERKSSIFTDALIYGLNGAGATDSEGDWRVTAMRLKEALDFHLERALKTMGRAQVPATDNAVPMELHHLGTEPTGTAIIACDPGEATRVATLAWDVGGVTKRRRGTRKGEWVLELPAGSYEFRAEFTRGPWRADPKKAYIRPVYLKVPIKASR
jgi:hypothetical protein